MLVDSKLRPLGVVCPPDGSQPVVQKANPLLALRFRWVVSDPAVTRRVTAPFRWLFLPPVVAAVVVAFVLVCKWVLFDRGLALAAHQAFDRPGLLLAVFAITVVSAGFHEFGHAAAARYGGATPGAMGAGLYLVWPAFYTDVTDSYTLGRPGRIRTDLGGLYFNALVSVAMFGVWALTGWDEAYAFASCTACRTTAISFQVVLILGNAHVVVPQNIPAAVNYDCLACVTQALAVQLVLSLTGSPSAAETADIEAVWREIQAFAGRLGGLSYAEIHARLHRLRAATGRCRRQVRTTRRRRLGSGVQWRCHRLADLASHLVAGGATRSVVHRWPLGRG